MAFAGSFGASANLIPFGILSSKQWGTASGYDANGNLQFTTPGGTVLTPERIDDLFIAATQVAGPSDPLAALIDNDDTGAGADSGVLVTAAPAANQHGLPANFGPGRGNWTADDLGALKVTIPRAVNTVAAGTNVGGPVVRSINVAAGDVTVAFKNMSEVVLNNATIRVQMEHTIQP